MEKQLSELTTVELKAIAYDQMAQLELAQNNLRVINQELSKRQQTPQNTPPNEEPVPVDFAPPDAGSIQSI